MLVAQGSGEVMVDYGVHVWDVAAIKPIVEEAGGQFTNWDGQQDIHRPDVIVTNGKLHDDLLAIFR
jgi:histidinol-phosphatase